MSIRSLRLYLFLLAVCFCRILLSTEDTKHATFSVQKQTILPPGSDVSIILACQIDPGWHLYWKNPGAAGAAPTFSWNLPKGVFIKEVQWPSPRRFDFAGSSFFGYEGSVNWLVTLTFSKDLPEGSFEVPLTIFWISCGESCVPETERLKLSFTVSPDAPVPILPGIKEVEKQLPIQVHGSTFLVEKQTLRCTLPIEEIGNFSIKNVEIFPLDEKVHVGSPATYTYKNGAYLITAPILNESKNFLLQSGEFSGIIQFLGEKKEDVLSYEIHSPVKEAIPPTETPEELWKKAPSAKEVQKTAGSTLALFLLFSFLGGLILNITPCVLPVLGIKIMQLISFKNTQQHSALAHGIIYTLGVLCTFWLLALGLFLIRYAGNAAGWGFQLQEPRFVLFLVAILFCFALNLFGVFECGTKISQYASQIQESSQEHSPSVTLWSSFISGILATIVATPCTGPLLGSVLGFAATIHPLEGFYIFTAIGLGVAFPFLLCTAFPSLLGILPKPGKWMVTIKQFFGFCMLAVVIWLFSVLEIEVPSLCSCCFMTGLFFIALGLFLYAKASNPLASSIRQYGMKTVFAISFFLGVFLLYTSIDQRPFQYVKSFFAPKHPIEWSSFSEEKLEEALSQNKIVFVEFSAKWCLICQTNHLVLNSASVAEDFATYDVVALRGDWTNGDKKITKMLEALGRNGVPVYAIFTKGKAPILLPEVLTPLTIKNGLKEAS